MRDSTVHDRACRCVVCTGRDLHCITAVFGVGGSTGRTEIRKFYAGQMGGGLDMIMDQGIILLFQIRPHIFLKGIFFMQTGKRILLQRSGIESLDHFFCLLY